MGDSILAQQQNSKSLPAPALTTASSPSTMAAAALSMMATPPQSACPCGGGCPNCGPSVPLTPPVPAVPAAAPALNSKVEGPDVTDQVIDLLTAGVITIVKSGQTLLSESFVTETIKNWHSYPGVSEVVNGGIAEVEIAGDVVTANLPTAYAPILIEVMEREFILDKDTSSLDLLPNDKGKGYRTFDWDRLDYPGDKDKDKKGPHEGYASSLDADLSKIRPERRANISTEAIITKEWLHSFTGKTQAAISKYIIDQLEPIPAAIQAPKGKRLNKLALASLIEMHAAAQAEGVELKVFDAYRDPETAKKNAAASGNPNAVASFSSHSLGLAIDFAMSYSRTEEVDIEGVTTEKVVKTNFAEATTIPFGDVVKMRGSPAHKWLFLRGAEHGWYPFQPEPWHFEYNPAGFRTTFWAEAEPAVQTAIKDVKAKEDEKAAEEEEKAAKEAAKKKAEAERRAQKAAERAARKSAAAEKKKKKK